jgi:hypothetical protein
VNIRLDMTRPRPGDRTEAFLLTRKEHYVNIALMTDEEIFVYNIAFALSRALPAKYSNRIEREEEIKRIAKAIADHLKLTNWKIQKGPPLKPHG